MNEEKKTLEEKIPNKITRRKFLSDSGKIVIGLVGAGMLSSAAFVYGGINNPKPASDQKDTLVELGTKSDLDQIKETIKIDYNTSVQDGWVEQKVSGFVYVTKDKNSNLLIISPMCTHLGCTVPFASEDQKQSNTDLAFLCPCHQGEYDEIGINIGGPPPRPLDIFRPIIREGKVSIDVFSPIKRSK